MKQNPTLVHVTDKRYLLDGTMYRVIVYDNTLCAPDFHWSDSGYGNRWPCSESWMDARLKDHGIESEVDRANLVYCLCLAVHAHNREAPEPECDRYVGTSVLEGGAGVVRSEPTDVGGEPRVVRARARSRDETLGRMFLGKRDPVPQWMLNDLRKEKEAKAAAMSDNKDDWTAQDVVEGRVMFEDTLPGQVLMFDRPVLLT